VLVRAGAHPADRLTHDERHLKGRTDVTNPTNELRMQPSEVLDSTKRLDVLADRIDRLMRTESADLTVTAAGHDEVSQRAAVTLNDAHTGFADALRSAGDQARSTAATLRAHADQVMAAEQDFSA
jgi:hypothetical protein